MTNFTEQQRAANYMGAVSHLLSGRAGRHEEFIDKVDLLLAGSAPQLMQLMQFGAGVRATGRPLIWIHHSAEVPNVPQIAVVAKHGEQVFTVESAMLLMAAKDDRAWLVPDGFNMGAFRFDDDFALRYVGKAPARTFKSAEPSMIRAYDRLRTIEIEQLDRGEIFELPELAKAA